MNIYRGFWESLAPACTDPTILPRSWQFVMLWMQVSTVLARISNILLIKSLLVARLANRHSCVTAGAPNSPEMLFLAPSHRINHLPKRGPCFDLHPQSSISARRNGPFFFPTRKWKEEKSDGKYCSNEHSASREKSKRKNFIYHFYALRHTSVCIHRAGNLFWGKADRLLSAAVARHTSPLSPRLA